MAWAIKVGDFLNGDDIRCIYVASKYRQDPINELEEEQRRSVHYCRETGGAARYRDRYRKGKLHTDNLRTKQLHCQNNTKVYMVTETLSDEWTKMVEFYQIYVIALGSMASH
jgi:hypothetical protein